LPNQHGQVLAEAEVAAATSEVAAVSADLLVVALAPRQPSTVAAFQHRLSAVHTLPAEVLADQMSRLVPTMVVLACRPCDRRDSLAQWVRPQDRMSALPP